MKKQIQFVFSLLAALALFACSLIPAIKQATAAPGGEEPGGLILTKVPPAPASLLCTDPQPPFVTRFEVRQAPQMEEPAARLPFRDPVFRSCIVRVSDRRADLAAGDTSPGLKNEYSRVQSFNADGSLILVRGVDGTWYVYSAATLQPLGQVPIVMDPRWSATDPFVIYYASDTHLMSYNLQTSITATVHDFTADAPGAIMVWTRYEGSPSADGRYWGLMAEDEHWLTSAYIVYDLQTDTVLATRDLRTWPDDERQADSVTISPLGNYFLVQMDKYCELDKLGTDARPCGLMVYDRNLQNGRGLLRTVGHSDTALDAQAREVFVYQDIDTDNYPCSTWKEVSSPLSGRWISVTQPSGSMSPGAPSSIPAGSWSPRTTATQHLIPGWTTRSSPSNSKPTGASYAWHTPTPLWIRSRNTITGPSRRPASMWILPALFSQPTGAVPAPAKSKCT
jgi:hypothetical protein